MNIQQALEQADYELCNASPSATLDAQVLLTHVLHCNTAHLLAWPEKELNKKQTSNFLSLVKQRQSGKPVAYLTGFREFWSLNFLVNDSTLIPRPETETLIEFVLNKFTDKKSFKLIDMGTGTGAIAISIGKEKPDWIITASDVSTDALELAKKNAKHHHTNNIAFTQSNWFENINTTDFDIIISNPPYIAENDPHLKQGDVRFEPQSALTSGKTGMDDIHHLCQHAKDYLASGGWLIVEHGYNQNQLVANCFAENDFTQIKQSQDLSGHTRMTAGKK
ncbi:Peptide chain release factor N(5)-glutamine methyltransferase [hydrothermal vent metagenome]|uniref:peptide chain release factor N(5)-glutamine methyltransferase n=1 Tax=hydrothermal vent metagenome TaxID=652676 RepID=A0A3B0WGA0_9ZZZZ